MWADVDQVTYQRFLDDATVFWRDQIPVLDQHRCVLVDGCHPDLRVLLRNLTVANAIRRLTGCRMVVLVGPGDDWPALWGRTYDPDRVAELARAYGADEVVDLEALRERRLLEQAATRRGAPVAGCPDDLLPQVDATFRRVHRLARVTAADREKPRYAHAALRAGALAELAADVITATAPLAVVLAEVDDDPWAMLVRGARLAGVPVVWVRPTGGVQAYALFPEHDHGGPTFPATLTARVGEFFAERVWARRDELRPAADRMFDRARRNWGRPAGWRSGPGAWLELTNPVQRAQLRQHVAARLGLDPRRPTVVLFGQRLTDPLPGHQAAFVDVSQWLERSVAFARTSLAVNWLVLSHPDGDDPAGAFAALAASCAGVRHIAFRSAAELTRNALFSLVDLGVTVRGAVASELPAYGIPVLQAGWSAWSGCGLTTVAADEDSYWRELKKAVAGLPAGRPVLAADQVERARLWLWLQRCGADISSGLIPPWDLWPAEYLVRAVDAQLRGVDPQDDPLFAAVARMWQQKLPLLTRTALPPISAAPVRPHVPHTRTGREQAAVIGE